MTNLAIPASQLRHHVHVHQTTGHSAAAPILTETTPAVSPTGIFGASSVPFAGFGSALGAAVAAGESAHAPALFPKSALDRDAPAAAIATSTVTSTAVRTAATVALASSPVAKSAVAVVVSPAPAAGNAETNWAPPPAANASAVNVGLARSADPKDAAVLLANLNGDQTAVNQMHNFYDVGGQGYKPWLNQLVTLGLDAPLPGAMAQQWASEGLGAVAADGRWTWADGKGW